MLISIDIILIMIMIRLSKRIMVIMKMVMIFLMFCIPELAIILKQQSYPNCAPCPISRIAGRDILWTPSTFSDAPYYVVWGVSTYQDVCVSFCAVTCRDLDKWIFVKNNKKILNYYKSIVICPQSISPHNLHTCKLNNLNK